MPEFLKGLIERMAAASRAATSTHCLLPVALQPRLPMIGDCIEPDASRPITTGPGSSGTLPRPVNLGDDTDTTGAVCGQLAGAYWGALRIRGPWLDGQTECGMIEKALVSLLKSLG